MQQLAMSWLIYRLTDSAYMLGIVGFCSMIPSLVLFPLNGLAADRANKQKILLITQSLSLIQALVLAILVFMDMIHIYQIIGLALFLGITNSFDMPVRQSFVVELVDRPGDLANAIALNSSLFNSARLIGPTVAGALIAVAGEGVCFLINAISYGAILISLTSLKLKSPEKRPLHKSPLKDIAEGISYTFRYPPIRMIILFLSVMSFSWASLIVLLPIYAKSVMNGNAQTLGLLSGASGFGALAGALYLASRKKIPGLERLIAFTGITFGMGVCLIAFSRVMIFSQLLMALTGFSIITVMAGSNTVLQTITEDSMRGRVLSFYVLSLAGVAPLGSLLMGSLAERYGVIAVFQGAGLLSIAAGFILALVLPKIKRLIRPVYIKKGIIQEISTGIQNADTLSGLQKE